MNGPGQRAVALIGVLPLSTYC